MFFVEVLKPWHRIWRGVQPKLGGGNSKIFYVHPEPGGNDPIWLYNMFQMGWLKPPTRKEMVLQSLPRDQKEMLSAAYVEGVDSISGSESKGAVLTPKKKMPRFAPPKEIETRPNSKELFIN